LKPNVARGSANVYSKKEARRPEIVTKKRMEYTASLISFFSVSEDKILQDPLRDQ
jgi:hypothetical protein